MPIMSKPPEVNESPEINPASKLSEEDIARVNAYLNSPVHRRERAPFRPWVLMLVLSIVVTGLTALSLLYAWQHGTAPR
jgi:hypothetical protein